MRLGVCVYLAGGGTRWFGVSTFAEAACRTTVRHPGEILRFERMTEQEYIAGGWRHE